MKQSRMTSLLKSCVSTAVGFAVAFVANMLILPWFGLPITHTANLLLTTIYTVISIVRGYGLERVFEAMGWRQRISPFMSAVIAERQRQITHEGYSIEHDDELARGALSEGAIEYAAAWWDNDASTARRTLVKSGALIAAEGEKFDRSRKSQRNERTMTDDRAGSRSSLMNQTNIEPLAHHKRPSEHAGSSV